MYTDIDIDIFFVYKCQQTVLLRLVRETKKKREKERKKIIYNKDEKIYIILREKERSEKKYVCKK